MSKATATLEPETLEPETSKAIPDGAWVSARTLSMMGLGSILSLTERIERGEQEDGPPEDGVRKVRHVDDDLCVFSDDLSAILGEELASSARAYQPMFTGLFAKDRDMLGMDRSAIDQDVLDLASRRGVLVRDDQKVDRRGLELLGKLLTREGGMSSNADDVVRMSVADAMGLREIVRTPVFEDPPKPRPKPRFNPFAPKQSEADLEPRHQIERYDPDELTKKRCRILGIRPTQPTGFNGSVGWAVGVDCYRLAGIHPHKIMYNRPQFMDAYQVFLANAYDQVFSN